MIEIIKEYLKMLFQVFIFIPVAILIFFLKITTRFLADMFRRWNIALNDIENSLDKTGW